MIGFGYQINDCHFEGFGPKNLEKLQQV